MEARATCQQMVSPKDIRKAVGYRQPLTILPSRCSFQKTKMLSDQSQLNIDDAFGSRQ